MPPNFPSARRKFFFVNCKNRKKTLQWTANNYAFFGLNLYSTILKVLWKLIFRKCSEVIIDAPPTVTQTTNFGSKNFSLGRNLCIKVTVCLSVCLCICTKGSRPIKFTFIVKLNIGPGKVNNYIVGGNLYPPMGNTPVKNSHTQNKAGLSLFILIYLLFLKM